MTEQRLQFEAWAESKGASDAESGYANPAVSACWMAWLAACASRDAEETGGRRLKNAHLIAAAPDLLEAAEAVNVSAVTFAADEFSISGEVLRKLLAAIAKATGSAS